MLYQPFHPIGWCCVPSKLSHQARKYKDRVNRWLKANPNSYRFAFIKTVNNEKSIRGACKISNQSCSCRMTTCFISCFLSYLLSFSSWKAISLATLIRRFYTQSSSLSSTSLLKANWDADESRKMRRHYGLRVMCYFDPRRIYHCHRSIFSTNYYLYVCTFDIN